MFTIRTITVMDPYGHCRSLLDGAVDAFNVREAVSAFMQLLDSCKPRLPECRKVVVLDIRRLPRRPKKPWNKLVLAISDLTSLSTVTVVLYTDDPIGRPRWINIDDVYALCSE